MDPFEYMQKMTSLWSQGGAAMLSAQRAMLEKRTEQAANSDRAEGEPAKAALGLADLKSAGEDFAKAWDSALQASKAATQHFKDGTGPSPFFAEMLGKMFDPRYWLSSGDNMDEALNRMAEGPRFADLWVIERKFSAVFTAWTSLRRRNLAHNQIMLEAWIRATEQFSKTMAEQDAGGAASKSWKDMAATWVEIANKTLLETQRTEPYLASQRELLNASTALRLAQQELTDFYGEVFGYPTRTELDDVYKAVTELKREFRAERRKERAQRDKISEAAARTQAETAENTPVAAPDAPAKHDHA